MEHLYLNDLQILGEYGLSQQLGTELEIQIIDGFTEPIKAHRTHEFP